MVTIGDNTEGLGGQVSGDGLRSFRIPKHTGRGKTSKTKTVEEIQEQVSNDPSLGVAMGKCIIKLSKKAKNKSGPKLKKKGSYRKVWISESAESDGEQVAATGHNASEGGGSQSPEVSAVVPAGDKFSDTSESD